MRAGIHQASSEGLAVLNDRHPDPIVEALRWQVAEAGVLQAIGRTRAVWRTAQDAVTIDLWSDLALPITIDKVEDWKSIPSGAEAEMLAEGIVLGSSSDASKCWPGVWPTSKAAERWKDGKAFPLAVIEGSLYNKKGRSFWYQPIGNGQQQRCGWHDPAVIPNPRAWLEDRLGPLAKFDLVPPDTEASEGEIV